jgi:hypothetical protein
LAAAYEADDYYKLLNKKYFGWLNVAVFQHDSYQLTEHFNGNYYLITGNHRFVPYILINKPNVSGGFIKLIITAKGHTDELRY